MTKFYLDRHPDDDRPPPKVRDVVRSSRTDRRVLDVWETESARWPNRWTVVVGPSMPAGSLEPLPPDGEVLEVTTYRRGEGPEDFYGPATRATE